MGLCENTVSLKVFRRSAKGFLARPYAQLSLSDHSWGIISSLRQMHQRLSGDISSVKIPLAGLKTSCSQRKLLYETEQRVQPSFSDKGIKSLACVSVGFVCVCGTEAVPHKGSPLARQVEAGKESEGVTK